jgi:hypothetical protein
MKPDPENIKAILLVDKINDFIAMVPEKKQWSVEKLSDNQFKLVLWQQIDVLLQVFLPDIYQPSDMVDNVKNLFDGRFLSKRSPDDYPLVFDMMDKEIIAHKPKAHKSKPWEIRDLIYHYSALMAYKQKIDKIVNFGGGTEFSYHHYYATAITNDVFNSPVVEKINKFLSLVIDPTDRMFSKNELISKYNYPKDDLFDVFMDNW